MHPICFTAVRNLEAATGKRCTMARRESGSRRSRTAASMVPIVYYCLYLLVSALLRLNPPRTIGGQSPRRRRSEALRLTRLFRAAVTPAVHVRPSPEACTAVVGRHYRAGF
ncbi:hypothetical protein BS50DRAFT_43492 [Corynespora cassiicola Philippines]|uniref:Uncharacterized protein n=1 Tax=Corynespora cassiicola Philippines TaxID=1448308 RepID=A0A2T2PD48_CORCC|nr:hypothetical protein BS50DRAFT_43492 [Corynespora cassiicola Philippines]